MPDISYIKMKWNLEIGEFGIIDPCVCASVAKELNYINGSGRYLGD